MTLHAFLTQLDAPSSTGAEQADAFSVLGPGQSRWAAVVSRRAVTAIVASAPGERATWLAPRLRPAVEQTVADLLVTLGDTPADRSQEGPTRPPVVLNQDETELVTTLAREDIPFHRVVAGLRILQSTCIAELLDTAERYRPVRDRAPLLRRLTDAVVSFFDATVDAVVARYQEERDLLITRRLTSRRTLVDAILAGSTVRNDDARRSLGLDLTAHHLALVAFSTAPTTESFGPGDLPDLESTARRAAEALRSPSHLTVPDENGLWIWLSRADPFTEADLHTLRTAHITAGDVRIAVGEPGRGAAGFRRSHLAAQDTARVARTSRAVDAAASVVAHSEVSLIALLLTDPERTRWFVAEELGKLAGPDAGTDDLRRTVLSYLDTGSSLVGTALALHVHRNTVVYRLRRVEELLGRPLTERTLALHAALRLDDVLE